MSLGLGSPHSTRWASRKKSCRHVFFRLQVATDQLNHTGIIKTLDTDLYLWKRKDIYVARKIEQLVTYRCHMAYACNCRCMPRVTTTDSKVWVEVKAPHNPDSHAQETLIKLHTSQKAAVIKAVQADPSLSSTAIRRAVTLSTEISPALKRSVTYLFVKSACK
jgi:hypothetical protein